MALPKDKLLQPRPLVTDTARIAGTGYSSAISKIRSSIQKEQQQPTSQTGQTLNTIKDTVSAKPYEFHGPSAFTYDKDSDPAYQAALASARQNITQQQADTNAVLRASGQGKSSYSESVANQIGAKEMGRVSTEVLPRLIEQAYSQYADQANRGLQVQQMNYGAGQDRIANLGNLYAMQDQEYFRNPMAEAQLTGNYLSGEARQYINAINALKAQAEAPGVTREQLQGFRSEADEYRSALRALGVDAGLFGADVNRESSIGNLGRAGIQTLDSQNMRFNQDLANRQFEQGVTDSDRNYGLSLSQLTGQLPDGSPTTAEQQRQLSNLWIVAQQTGRIPNELADMYGIQRGTQTQDAYTQAQQLAISRMNANTSAYSASTSRMSANNSRLMDIWQATGVAPAGIPGVAAGTPYGSEQDRAYRQAQIDQATGTPQVTLSDKESRDNLNSIRNNLKLSTGVEEAVRYLESMKLYLTDSDYKAAWKSLEDTWMSEE
ncbi:hypothetical protein RB620_04365 [Paenibacillus sp. LHD-117]|uniref:hypothetical protein n=1 Tax=Paenibacillus sp. LHD-117 TaxID=3071412 RepID=UPI0027E17AAE|nr:hypothetical protein [Paenibacillus sp. LHD-117]MDQ6418666.1 hypothetical protein [Paenibacillus sp. LHD-117]